MKFLDAVVLISKLPGWKLCDDPDELSGVRPRICVYFNDDFMGKLGWPRRDVHGTGFPAYVDHDLIEALKRAAAHPEGTE
jgi:hypothetical protein